jgi:uncharacterized protein YceH (UPF0502 family)
MDLTPYEARVIGSLIEKQVTTPDQYPLSLNALVNACNQKSNREPVLSLDEATVQQVLDDLAKKHLVSETSGFGSRVPKYQQRFCNTGFNPLEFTEQQLGVVCALLLRGPQTPGELRTRTSRMCSFSDVHAVEAALTELMGWEQGPLVARLPREAGRRESRYAHLFSGEVHPEQTTEPQPEAQPHDATGSDRILQLEELVEQLRGQVDALARRVEQLESASRTTRE